VTLLGSRPAHLVSRRPNTCLRAAGTVTRHKRFGEQEAELPALLVLKLLPAHQHLLYDDFTTTAGPCRKAASRGKLAWSLTAWW
jgi:hypothetical protein